ncbi:predicted protein [Plenodomus lingam JN3]|uniref:Predicted protein n=1 Tax=Leptosphaeria maculans (strain JN3 / isolate v23.1.3 / race Av1-4-5-6-7-8) TaxID=985895 RepID=E5AFL7_LEPMJ|nr:predicted protein [Plenodomus lingam JN3]CBY02006.1 predicted protein [Plenodomus lingam JN3]
MSSIGSFALSSTYGSNSLLVNNTHSSSYNSSLPRSSKSKNSLWLHFPLAFARTHPKNPDYQLLQEKQRRASTSTASSSSSCTLR